MKEKLYGIIGNPVLHSLSPALHNYWFKKYNLNSSYNLFNIKENEIEKMLDRVRSGEINGLNVTLPYKQKVISYLRVHMQRKGRVALLAVRKSHTRRSDSSQTLFQTPFKTLFLLTF